LPPWEIAGAALILLGVTAAVIASRRKCPYLLVGWLWFIGMLLPVIGLVPFGGQTAADRFTYLPQIGLCMAVAWAAADWCRESAYRRWACGLGSALALAALMGCAWQQTSYWRDSETLWTHTLDCTSRNYRVHSLLGNALALRGRTDDAVVQFQQTIAIKPDHADAQYGLGVAAASRGRMDDAIAHYRKAIAARPNFAVAHNNLGNALLMRGQIDEATKHFLIAIEVRPEFAEAYFNLGNVLYLVGRFNEAITQYQRALEFRPDYAEAHYHLGLALDVCGRHDDAVKHYRQFQEIEARVRGNQRQPGL
jgi:tetratricopeptide (TPR) repeat protein